jgi:hypothetical protein
MVDEGLTQRVVAELALPEQAPDFLERLWDEVQVRDRRAARTWRRIALLAVALVFAGVGLAVSVVAAVGSSAIDITLRCTVPPHAGERIVSASVSPSTPGSPDPRKPFPGYVTLTAPAEATYFAADTAHSGYLLDRTRCKKVSPKPPLVAGALPATGTITNDGFKGLSVACKTGGPLLFRIRLSQDDKGVPTRALLVVRAGRNAATIAFFDWTPQRAITYATASPRCEVR